MRDDGRTGVPVVVSGLGRCGSSMVMKMLIAGGMVAKGQKVGPPLYEDERVALLPGDSDWLRGFGDGDVIKILGPDIMRPPEWFECKGIWMRRAPAEQAKSMVKYREARGLGKIENLDLGRARRDIKRRTEKALKILKRCCRHGFLHVSFEEVLRNPIGAAKRLCGLVGVDMSIEGMVAVVERRSAECVVGVPDLAGLKVHR